MKQISEEDLAETLNDTGCYPTQESIKEDIAKYYEDCHCDRIPRLEKWLTRCGELIRINRRKFQEERLRADDLQGEVMDYKRQLNLTIEDFHDASIKKDKENAELRSALERYSVHDIECPYEDTGHLANHCEECTCGLKEALTGKED